ncbi:MAG: porin family protein [Gemmatimonadota bacterium]|nr:porin family protein [Gemmatimonadota bacterium]
MRRAVACLGLLGVLLFATPLNGQLTLGARGGTTLSTLDFTDETGGVQDAAPKYGAHGAVSLAYSLSDRLGLVLEAGYTQRGAELTILDYDAYYDAIWWYDYLDFSLLGRSSFGPAYLLAGPAASRRTACYTVISHRSTCESVGAVFREYDYFLIGGAGVGLDTGPVTWVAEGLYNLGLLNIDNEGVTTTKHRGFVMRLGVDWRG